MVPTALGAPAGVLSLPKPDSGAAGLGCRGVDLQVIEGRDEYAPGERHAAVAAATEEAGRLVIFFTGAAGNERRFVEDEYAPVTGALAAAGLPVISAEFGGGYAWGNDASIDRIGRLWRFGVEGLGARDDRLLGVGVSKGATALLNYARRRRGDVAAVAALIPALDLAAIHDRSEDMAAEIEAAYDGASGYAKAVDRYNPMAHAEAYRGLPICCWSSLDDPAIPFEEVREFARRAKAELRPFGPAGHSIEGIDAEGVASFLAGA
jgi:hypothetical protein